MRSDRRMRAAGGSCGTTASSTSSASSSTSPASGPASTTASSSTASPASSSASSPASSSATSGFAAGFLPNRNGHLQSQSAIHPGAWRVGDTDWTGGIAVMMRRAAMAALGAVLVSGAIATMPVAHATDKCVDWGLTGVALSSCESARAFVGTPCTGNVFEPNDGGTLSHPVPEGCDPSLPYKDSAQ